MDEMSNASGGSTISESPSAGVNVQSFSKSPAGVNVASLGGNQGKTLGFPNEKQSQFGFAQYQNQQAGNSPTPTEQPAAQEQLITAPRSAPERYEFKLPEGLSITPELEGRFTDLAKSMNLTQEQADGLIKLHSDVMLDAMRQAEAQKSKWAEECAKAGLSSPENMRLAKLAVDTFDDTGTLMNELIESGIAFSPACQKFLQTIGSYLAEDDAPDGKTSANLKNAADILFPNSKYN